MLAIRRWWPAALLAAAAGCGDAGPERVVVTGEVTYRGVPVYQGEVRFFPKEGTDTPMSGALIQDGRYTADALGGVPVGTFRIEVTGYRAARKTEGVDVENQTDGGQYLPARFNSASELELVVPPVSGPVTHDLRLAD